MPNEGQINDAPTLWRSQPAEATPVALALIHRRAQDLQAKTRREFAARIILLAGVALFCGWGCSSATNPAQQAAFLVAGIWSLAALYAASKRKGSSRLAGDLPLATGLEYCIGELGRHRDMLRNAWLWTIGPLLAAIGSFFLPIVIRNRDAVVKIAPFLILLSVWIAVFLVLGRRSMRRIEHEISELTTLRESQAG